MVTGKINVTTNEVMYELQTGSSSTVIFKAKDNDIQISVGNNTSYQDYDVNDVIPLELQGDKTNSFKTKIYVKAAAAAVLRYWIY